MNGCLSLCVSVMDHILGVVLAQEVKEGACQSRGCWFYPCGLHAKVFLGKILNFKLLLVCSSESEC